MGIAAADLLGLGPAPAAGVAAAAGIAALLCRGRVRLCAFAVAAAAVGAAGLAEQTNAPIPDPGGHSVPVTLVGVPRESEFGCGLSLYVHGRAPGRALVYAPRDTCRWAPGRRAVARLDLRPFPPATNPGGPDPARLWGRRGVHRTGRVVEDRIVPVEPPPRSVRAWIERLRRTVSGVLDPNPSMPSGALLRALVTGDRSRLTASVRSPFERSGTAHLLAVSGLHIGWAFLFGRLLGRLVGFPLPSRTLQRIRPRVALGVGLATAGGYAALAGLSVPTLRAVAMAAAGAVAVLSGRAPAGWNALLAAAGVVLAVDPASLFEPGLALSFLAVAGILLWRPSGGGLSRLVGCTLGASLATAPWLASMGLPLPVLSVLANLLLVPAFGLVAVPLGLLAASLVAASAEAAASVAVAARGAVGLGASAARLLESPDLLAGPVDPLGVAAVSSGLLALRSLHRGDRRLARGLAALAVGLALAAWPGPRQGGWRGTTEILFLEVGHGDATLVRSGPTHWLIDAGPRTTRFDAGRRIVLPALRAWGVDRLEVLVVTHADRDHLGGVAAVLERVPVGEVWLGRATLDDPALLRVRRVAAARGVPLRVVSRGDRASVGSWTARVLWPPEGSLPSHRNDAGVVLRIEGSEGCVLLPADVSQAVEAKILGSLRPCAVLKLGHHGSRTSTGPRWLEALDPELAVASASRGRTARFPAVQVRARLNARGVTLYETARFGAVRVSFGPGSAVVAPYRVEVGPGG